nr:MAG: capsid protein [Wufeng shrew picorna-like virus 27]
MSRSAPPVPSDGGVVFTSTDSGIPAMPGIRVVADSPSAELPTHVGNVGTLDPQIYQQRIQIATAAWSSDMGASRVIATFPIHPSVHMWTDYLSAMYNGWTGGFIFDVRPLGTGFHAGQLAATRVPPNLDVSQFRTPAQLSALETVYIDPKDLNAVSIEIMDQRPIMYHMTNIDKVTVSDRMTPSEKFMNSTTFGGTLVLWVSGQLNTSSSGSNQIDLVIWCRPSPTFDFAQILPPRATVTPDTYFTTLIESALDFRFADRCEAQGGRLATIAIAFPISQTEMSHMRINFQGCFNSDGIPLEKVGPNFEQRMAAYLGASATKGKITKYKNMTPSDLFNLYTGCTKDLNITDELQVNPCNFRNGATPYDQVEISQNYALGPFQFFASNTKVWTYQGIHDTTGAGTVKLSSFQLQLALSSPAVDECYDNVPSVSVATAPDYEPINSTYVLGTFVEANVGSKDHVEIEPLIDARFPKIALPLAESLFVFASCGSADGAYGGSFQTTRLRTIFENGSFKRELGVNSNCALLQIHSVAAGAPISYAKLYPEGFLTVPPVVNATLYDLSDLTFSFVQIMQRAAPFPKPGNVIEQKMAQRVSLETVHRGYGLLDSAY